MDAEKVIQPMDLNLSLMKRDDFFRANLNNFTFTMQNMLDKRKFRLRCLLTVQLWALVFRPKLYENKCFYLIKIPWFTLGGFHQRNHMAFAKSRRYFFDFELGRVDGEINGHMIKYVPRCLMS